MKKQILTQKRFQELLNSNFKIARRDVGKCYVSKIDGSYMAHVDENDLSGSIKRMKQIFKLGITEQLQSANNDRSGSVTIGYNPESKRWYGWSHRMMASFGIGDRINKESILLKSGWVEGSP